MKIGTRLWINIAVTAVILFSLLIVFNCKKEPLKVAPTVTMTSVTSITSISASTGGNVTTDGGATVIARGICWSATNKTPTTADGNVSNGGGLGNFTSLIVGLTPGSTYYVNAYATNSIGTSYSSTSSFTTLAVAPIITTADMTNITTTTATCGGTIPNDGGSPVTARGVCWSTNQNPTIADSKTMDGTGTGSFSSNITNLKTGTTYYVRAYATNSLSTSYGNQVTVKIPCPITQISETNRKTAHYNPYFIPFTNYWSLVQSKAVKYNCTGLTGRTFLNLNNNSTPDLVITETNGCQNAKGKVFVYIDNVLKWSFEDPQILTRKMMRGDFNEDGIDDVVLFGSGYDGPPYPGEKNYIIYFKSDSYSIVELDPANQYTHGGAVGDINNDGHIDIIPIPNQFKDCFAFINDGTGNFIKKKLFTGAYTDIAFHSELYDINNDGNLDIILGGHEWADYPQQNPNTRILLGDGKGNFDTSNPIIIPKVDGWGVITDFDFYDLDKDGTEELIISRTAGSLGSSANGPKKNPNGFYDDFRIQILRKVGNSYIQTVLLSSPGGWEKTWIQWLTWTSIIDVDGDCNLDIVPDSENLNDSSFDELRLFNKLYYKGDGSGNFVISYKK